MNYLHDSQPKMKGFEKRIETLLESQAIKCQFISKMILSSPEELPGSFSTVPYQFHSLPVPHFGPQELVLLVLPVIYLHAK